MISKNTVWNNFELEKILCKVCNQIFANVDVCSVCFEIDCFLNDQKIRI